MSGTVAAYLILIAHACYSMSLIMDHDQCVDTFDGLYE